MYVCVYNSKILLHNSGVPNKKPRKKNTDRKHHKILHQERKEKTYLEHQKHTSQDITSSCKEKFKNSLSLLAYSETIQTIELATSPAFKKGTT